MEELKTIAQLNDELTGYSCPADDGTAKILDACIITKVGRYGEYIDGIRLTLTRRLFCDAFRYDSTFRAFSTSSDRKIHAVYVSASGNLGDASPSGKYILIEFSDPFDDPIEYANHVTYREATRTREASLPITVYIHQPLETCGHEVIAPRSIITTHEECPDIDRFTYSFFEKEGAVEIYRILYVPECYDGTAPIPLIVHFPSGDAAAVNQNGLYTGALYRHPDATIWASEEVQKEHPAIVLSAGRAGGFKLPTRGTYYEAAYVRMINDVLNTYNIDRTRIYSVSLAAGTVNQWNVAEDYPDLFTAFISTTVSPFSAEQMRNDWRSPNAKPTDPEKVLTDTAKLISNQPCWLFCGQRDPLGRENPYPNPGGQKNAMASVFTILQERGVAVDLADEEKMWNGLIEGSEQAEAQIQRAAGKPMVTLFQPNTILPNGHACWSSVYLNKRVRDWLFEQKKG